MPTCLYVLGGMVPVYSSKVWSNTLKYDPYYREADATMPDMVPPDYGSNMKDRYGQPRSWFGARQSPRAPLKSPGRGRRAERKYLGYTGGGDATPGSP